jgi:hypothetical protein
MGYMHPQGGPYGSSGRPGVRTPRPQGPRGGPPPAVGGISRNQIMIGLVILVVIWWLMTRKEIPEMPQASGPPSGSGGETPSGSGGGSPSGSGGGSPSGSGDETGSTGGSFPPGGEEPETSPPLRLIPEYTGEMKYLGCYIDSGDRALPHSRPSEDGGDRIGAVKYMSEEDFKKQCGALAMAAGATYFGRQDGNQCFWGMEDAEYDKHGVKAYCPSSFTSPGWANRTYQLIY